MAPSRGDILEMYGFHRTVSQIAGTSLHHFKVKLCKHIALYSSNYRLHTSQLESKSAWPNLCNSVTSCPWHMIWNICWIFLNQWHMLFMHISYSVKCSVLRLNLTIRSPRCIKHLLQRHFCVTLTMVFIFVVISASALPSSNTMEPCPALRSLLLLVHDIFPHSIPPLFPAHPSLSVYPIFLDPTTSLLCFFNLPHSSVFFLHCPSSMFCQSSSLWPYATITLYPFQCSFLFFLRTIASSPPLPSCSHRSFIIGWWRQLLASTKPWWSWSISPVTLGCGTLTTSPCWWPRWAPRIRR